MAFEQDCATGASLTSLDRGPDRRERSVSFKQALARACPFVTSVVRLLERHRLSIPADRLLRHSS
jgi:hypothetical protein